MTIPATGLIHFGIVVENAKASAQEFARMYGIPNWRVTEYQPDRTEIAVTRGFGAEHRFLVAEGRVSTEEGEVCFRLIEPRGGWSTYQEFLMQRGPGIHHVCTARITPAEFDTLQHWLATENIEIAQHTRRAGGGSEITLDTRDALGGFYVQLLVEGDGGAEPAADETWTFDIAPGMEQGLLPLGTFQMHFGVVVFDLVKRVREWSRLFGLTDWNFVNWHTAPGSLESPTNNGVPVNHAYFTTIATLGPSLAFEIIQPTFGPAHYRENFRDIVGEGIHHINATMLADREAWLEARDRMSAAGCEVVMSGDLAADTASFYYIDTKPKLGYVTEVVHPGSNWENGAEVVKIAMSANLSASA